MDLRRLLPLGLAVAAALAAVALLPDAASARLQPILVSKGTGKQTLVGGGLTYGTLRRGGTLIVRDRSGRHDMVPSVWGGRVQTTADGVGTVFRATGAILNFKIQGSSYQLILSGNSTLNGLDVSGRVTFSGKGRYWLNTDPGQAWSPAQLRLGPPASRKRLDPLKGGQGRAGLLP